jgi:hypothetical protein
MSQVALCGSSGERLSEPPSFPFSQLQALRSAPAQRPKDRSMAKQAAGVCEEVGGGTLPERAEQGP